MKTPRLSAAVLVVWCSSLLCTNLVAFGQTGPVSPAQYSFTVSASQLWTDAGVDLSAGDTLTFTAGAKPGADASCIPQGASTSTASSDVLPLSSAPAGALIAKLSENADPLLVGSGRDLRSDAAGYLFLGLSQATKSNCAFAVKLTNRHHFRLWKAPFTWNGDVVWVGAGTHDIGFEKDIRTGKLTHKIDPTVDGERENIAQSFDKSGKAKSMTYYLPPNRYRTRRTPAAAAITPTVDCS